MTIAIDGPAGAGKSTIAKRLAAALGYLYLDTGAMYRAVALKMLRTNTPLSDADAVEKTLGDTVLDVRYENGVQKVYLDGEDVNAAIRENEVSKAASAVSAWPCVRSRLVESQRAIAKTTDVILDGRDIGTFVLPQADCKFFLTASAEERARRRYEELRDRGATCSFDEILQDIQTRDYNDAHREFAPLKKAEDAIEVDTTHMHIDEVTAFMLQTVNGKKA